jgi:hypothetical protein
MSLERGIAAARAGNLATARELLTRAVRHQPDSERAWLWLSSVLDTPQGRAHCLERVLALNPDNEQARRGLVALERAEPAPALVARRPAARSSPPPPAPGDAVQTIPLFRRRRFWQVAISVLVVVALALIGLLAYAIVGTWEGGGGEVMAAIMGSPLPRGTLRATFTATPTSTPAATDTSTPTWTPAPTLTPLPTETPAATETPTPTPTDTPTPRPRARAPAAPTSKPSPRPTLPPRVIDPRLIELGIHVEPAFVSAGQPYWRLVKASWADECESGGKHSIFVEVLDAGGQRAVGQTVLVKWADGTVALPVKGEPAPGCGVDFGMYNTLGSYAVSVGGATSDRITGLGLGTAEAPNFTIHTSFYLTYRLVYR